jgi:hypothetical protein
VPVDAQQVRELALSLPRAKQAFVRDREKFRVGQLVFLSFAMDESMIGFAFPRELREAAVEAEPEKFLLPRPSDLRYRWMVARLAALDVDEMTELVTEAWAMCVPTSVARAYLDAATD